MDSKKLMETIVNLEMVNAGKPLDVKIVSGTPDNLKIYPVQDVCLGLTPDTMIIEGGVPETVVFADTAESINESLKEMASDVEPSNFGVFEDRALSLLNRWKKHYEKNKSMRGIGAACIVGFLSEISDDFTEDLISGILDKECGVDIDEE